MQKKLRLCIICGAKVTNINKKTVTCDQICTIARDGGINRERAMKMLAAGGYVALQEPYNELEND